MPEDTQACVPLLAQGAGRVWTRLEELGRLCVLLPYPIGLGSLELGRGAEARSSRRSPRLCAGQLGGEG